MSDSSVGNGEAPVRPRRPITWLFNIGLFVFLVCVIGVEVELLEPAETARVPLDEYFEAAPVRTLTGFIAITILIVSIGLAITLAFWNRFLTDVFSIRPITLVEAVAINLIIAIFLTST